MSDNKLRLCRWLLLPLLLLPIIALAYTPQDDPRYCGVPKRDEGGRIVRSSATLRDFKEAFPCPATLLPGKCPGWSVDHTIPLADNGCDLPVNMTWLPNALKSCPGKVCKDRWERVYHASPRRKVPG